MLKLNEYSIISYTHLQNFVIFYNVAWDNAIPVNYAHVEST